MYVPAVAVINQFIESELTRHENYAAKLKVRDADFESLNLLFKAVLEKH